MTPKTKKLIIIFVIMVVLGGGLIYYLRKEKGGTKKKTDKPETPKIDPKSKTNPQGTTPEKPIKRADRDKVSYVQLAINSRLEGKPFLPIPTNGIWTTQSADASKIAFGKDVSEMTYSEFMIFNQSYSEPTKKAAPPKIGI